ncbi:hypothetical protein NKDENANG_00907 [Candidatus Entotheonellaceae bacterium PAL068K]
MVQATIELTGRDAVDPLAAIEFCYSQGWTDGLPVVPPIEERLATFLGYLGRERDEVLGSVSERRRTVTLEQVVANAVMAGCLQEYMPVVVAAVEAMLQPTFNLVGPSASLGGSAILVIVNGPLADALQINCRNNLFGAGNRANATIGRAVRLVLMNTCGAIPGLFDRSCLGHPGKYTYCIAENAADSPWLPLHAERGFSPTDNAVTVFACEGPRQVRSSLIPTPEGVLTTVADAMSSLGTSLTTSGSVGSSATGTRQGEVALVIAAEHMRLTWRHGWGKANIRQFLCERARRNVADLKRGGGLPGEVESGDADTYVPVVAHADDILIVAAGGDEGAMSAVIPSWGPKVASTAVTWPIAAP